MRKNQTRNKEGKLHSFFDNPALEDGDDFYWLHNGVLHRTTGPAVVEGNYAEFWDNGNLLTFAEWCELNNISEELATEIVLKYEIMSESEMLDRRSNESD